MIHVGQSIQTVLRNKGKSVTWLADQLGYTRANIYKIFLRNNLEYILIRNVSLLLEHNFFEDMAEDLRIDMKKTRN